MPDVSVQFHACPGELADFFGQCVSDYNLHVVKVTFPPYRAEEVPRDSLGDIVSESSNTEAIAFTVEKPILVKTSRDLRDENPDALHLHLGKKSEAGLKESHLSARTTNMDSFAVWKKIAKRLKAITAPGAIAINPDTGVSGTAKWHRFTEGARKLDASGVRLLSVTGIILKPR
jgi:hypothetical protein